MALSSPLLVNCTFFAKNPDLSKEEEVWVSRVGIVMSQPFSAQGISSIQIRASLSRLSFRVQMATLC